MPLCYTDSPFLSLYPCPLSLRGCGYGIWVRSLLKPQTSPVPSHLKMNIMVLLFKKSINKLFHVILLILCYNLKYIPSACDFSVVDTSLMNVQEINLYKVLIVLSLHSESLHPCLIYVPYPEILTILKLRIRLLHPNPCPTPITISG